MKVKEMIAELQKADPEAGLTMSIGNPKDTAYTDDISVNVSAQGECSIVGWVSSDNEEAWFPDGS